MFVCVEVLLPSKPNGVMSSAVSLPNHTFTGQAWSSKRLTSIVHILSPETDNCLSWISGRERMTVNMVCTHWSHFNHNMFPLNGYPQHVSWKYKKSINTQLQVRCFFQPKSVPIFLISSWRHMLWALLMSTHSIFLIPPYLELWLIPFDWQAIKPLACHNAIYL